MSVRLHILGAGRTARTLARLWDQAGVLEIGQVRNRSLDSAREAVQWIGSGRAVERFEDVDRKDWLLVGVPDSAIESAVGRGVPATSLAFHLSGAESSGHLAGAAATVAAVHPVCAFADPELALRQFPGCFAVGEGDEAALDRLLPCFEAIGARIMRFDPADKRLYHAAMISASNFLCTLDQLAEDLAVAGGLDPAQARPLIATLQAAALGTIAERGGVAALTGPIERGDVATCEAMVERIRSTSAADPQFASRVEPLFAALASATVELARRKHPERADAFDRLHHVVAEHEG